MNNLCNSSISLFRLVQFALGDQCFFCFFSFDLRRVRKAKTHNKEFHFENKLNSRITIQI